MTTVASLGRVYKTYLHSAKVWMRQHGYDVDPAVGIVVTRRGDLAEIATTTPLHCRNWPYRNKSRERIDVLAEIQETVQLSSGHCVKATTRVNYFRIDGERAIATECLHYDFKNPPDRQHPICHVQTSNAIISTPESFDRIHSDVDDTALRNRCLNMRIPSAFVNLPGLLSILAADHMKPDDWREFITMLLRTCGNFPHTNHHLVNSAINGQLGAWVWYEN